MDCIHKPVCKFIGGALCPKECRYYWATSSTIDTTYLKQKMTKLKNPRPTSAHSTGWNKAIEVVLCTIDAYEGQEV